MQAGIVLDVVMTADAQRFVGAATFAALARRPVHTSLWDRVEEIPHIALARENELIAIVPATAHTMAKLALGLADDLLTNVALATRVPLVVAPAMNTAMLEHEATRANLATLRARGVTIVEPGVGFLAEREHGAGRLADEDALFAAIDRRAASHRRAHRRARRDHRRADPRADRPGALSLERIDRYRGDRAGARSAAARCSGRSRPRSDGARTAGGCARPCG